MSLERIPTQFTTIVWQPISGAPYQVLAPTSTQASYLLRMHWQLLGERRNLRAPAKLQAGITEDGQQTSLPWCILIVHLLYWTVEALYLSQEEPEIMRSQWWKFSLLKFKSGVKSSPYQCHSMVSPLHSVVMITSSWTVMGVPTPWASPNSPPLKQVHHRGKN